MPKGINKQIFWREGHRYQISIHSYNFIGLFRRLLGIWRRWCRLQDGKLVIAAIEPNVEFKKTEPNVYQDELYSKSNGFRPVVRGFTCPRFHLSEVPVVRVRVRVRPGPLWTPLWKWVFLQFEWLWMTLTITLTLTLWQVDLRTTDYEPKQLPVYRGRNFDWKLRWKEKGGFCLARFQLIDAYCFSDVCWNKHRYRAIVKRAKDYCQQPQQQDGVNETNDDWWDTATGHQRPPRTR